VEDQKLKSGEVAEVRFVGNRLGGVTPRTPRSQRGEFFVPVFFS